MPNRNAVFRALLWAAAILLNAAGNAAGLIADDVAQTLFIVFMVLAITSAGSRPCSLPRKEA